MYRKKNMHPNKNLLSIEQLRRVFFSAQLLKNQKNRLEKSNFPFDGPNFWANYYYIPGTPMTLILNGKGLLLEAKQGSFGFQVYIYIQYYGKNGNKALLYIYIPAPSKGCQLNPKGW